MTQREPEGQAQGNAAGLRAVTSAAAWMASWTIALAVSSGPLQADTFPLPENGEGVVGEIRGVVASAHETLLDIGRRHNLGYEEMKLANPGVDPWIPGEGTLIVIPSRFVLPNAPREGIVLNLAEMRLYYYPPADEEGRRQVVTHPVSIGQVDWHTPEGKTFVEAKAKNPAWYPPESIKAEHEAMGEPLPDVVPPGPDNPLGDHALRLGRKGYLIHGTNKPFGIGMRVSHGCIRMYPEDIARLFDDIPLGTPVHIVNEPIKAGWQDGVLYLETHPVMAELALGGAPDINVALRRVVALTSDEQSSLVRWDQIDSVVESMTGLPYAITSPSIKLKLAGGVPRAPARAAVGKPSGTVEESRADGPPDVKEADRLPLAVERTAPHDIGLRLTRALEEFTRD